MTDTFPGFSQPTRAPKRKPKSPFPASWTPEEQRAILAYCQRKTPQYLPVGKPGGLSQLMERMALYYKGEGAHIWRRDWVRTAYAWLLKQVEIDFRNAQRRRPGPGSGEIPQMERAKVAEEFVRKENSLKTVLDAIGKRPVG